MTQTLRLGGLILVLLLTLAGCADFSSITEAIQSTPETSGSDNPQPTPQVAQTGSEEATPTPTAGERGDVPLLFVSDRGKTGTTDIYQINADGSGLVRLTKDPASEQNPQWSPDQKQIAFTSDRTGTRQIYLMSTEDYSIEQLTDVESGAASPTWSPDGSKIAFVDPSAKGNVIHVVPARPEGDSATYFIDAKGLANPAWSPLGNKIAFSAQVEGHENNRGIFVYDINNTLLINLTNDPGNDDNPAWSSDGQRLVFQANRDGNDDIYVMNANGSLQTPLTTDPADDIEPAWTSDGRRIAFSSKRDGQFNIYLMSENGSEQEALAPFPADDRQPAWPLPLPATSDEMLYAGGILTDFRDLHLTSAEGTKRSQLTESDRSDDTIPDWSPDGSRIVFTSSRSGNYDIYIMKPDGTETVKLTTNPGDDMHPSWSPDGSKIVFESKQGDVDWDVWVMNVDGSNLQNLTADADKNDGNPTWSPDGKQIAFSTNRDGNYEIYVINADGSGKPIRLTQSDGNDFHPDWSPDGAHIAFRSASPLTGKRGIFIMTSDGQSPRKFFPSQHNDDTPAWSPDGQRLAFASDRRNENEVTPNDSYRIFVYNLETGKINQITHGNRDGRYPAWRPRQ